MSGAGRSWKSRSTTPGEERSPSLFGAPAPALAGKSNAEIEAAATRARGPGGSAGPQPMEPEVRDSMEGAFGTSFADVRIHEGGTEQAGALATTRGSDIHFAPGQYQPETPGGASLLGHELTHVVQQRQGAASPGQPQARAPGSGAVGARDPLEAEADAVGARVAAGGRAGAIEGTAPPGTAQNDGPDPPPKPDVLPAFTVDWFGDTLKVVLSRGKDSSFGRDDLVCKVTYAGGLPTEPADGIETFKISEQLSETLPVVGRVVVSTVGRVDIDLYGDHKHIVRLTDKAEPYRTLGGEKSRRHGMYFGKVGGGGMTGSLVVKDPSVDMDAPTLGPAGLGEDMPGANPVARLVDGGATEMRIDGDGDQKKELILRIREGTEKWLDTEWSKDAPKEALIEVVQVSSGKTANLRLALAQPAFGGSLFPLFKEATDGYGPTEIYLAYPDKDRLLRIDPPQRDPGLLTYTLKGPHAEVKAYFPAEAEGWDRVVGDVPKAPVDLGGMYGLDFVMGPYHDKFRVSIERKRTPALLSISSTEHGKADGAAGIELKIPVTSCWPMKTDGFKLALDLNADGEADVSIYDQLTTPDEVDGGGPPELNRNHRLRLVGPALEEKLVDFRVRDNYFTGGAATRRDLDHRASSNAAAIGGLQDQKALGSFTENMDAFEGAMFAERKKAFEAGHLPAKIYQNWSDLNAELTVIKAQVKGSGVDPSVKLSAHGHAKALYEALKEETKGTESTSAYAGIGFSSVSTKNEYTDERSTETWSLFTGTDTSVSGAGPELHTNIILERWDKAYANYNRLVAGVDKWIIKKLRDKGTKDDRDAADRLDYLGSMRNELGKLEDKNPTRLMAVFHPDKQYKEAHRIQQVPLSLYYWLEVTSAGHHWKVKDLTNPNNTWEDDFLQTRNCTPHPPKQLFQELNYKGHFPKGTIHYQIPGGEGDRIECTEEKTLSDWLTYIGLGVAAIGLGLATFGTGTVAVLGAYVLAASSVISAAAAAAHMAEEADHGNLSAGEAALDIAQIAAGLLGAGQLVAGRLVMSAGAASRAGAAWTGTMARVADWSQKAYVPLTVARGGADVATVVLASQELAKQLEAIEKSGADEGERTRMKALLLSQFAVTAGLVALSIKGDLPTITGGKSLYVYVPKEGGPPVAAHFEKPIDVKFTQATIGAKTSDDIPLDDLIKSMKTEGWKGDPLDVVTINGETISLDNRRLYAARAAGVEAPVLVHKPTDRLPERMIEEGRFRLQTDLWSDGPGKWTATKPEGDVAPAFTKGKVAETWEEAVLFRTANQAPMTGIDFPLMGSSGEPIILAKTFSAKEKRELGVPKVDNKNDVARLQTKGIVTEMEEGNLDKDLFSKKAADGSTYGDWYKKWIESPEPVKWVDDPATPGKTKPEVNAPRGMPEEFKPYLEATVQKGNVTLSLKIRAQEKKIAADIPGLGSLDPKSPTYAVERKKLVKEYGEDMVRKYETNVLGVEGTAGREAIYDQVHKVVDDKGLDILRGWLPGQEIYVTGGTAKVGKPLSDIADLDIMIIVPDGTGAGKIAELEARASSLVVPTSSEFATATGRGHLRVDATVRTRKNAFAAMTAETDRTPLQYARIDEHTPTSAETAFGYAEAKAAAGAHNVENISPAAVDALTEHMPGLKIDPADPSLGIKLYLEDQLGLAGLLDVKKLGGADGGASGALVFKVTKMPEGTTLGFFKIFRNKEEMLREIASLQKLKDAGMKIMKPVGIHNAGNVDGAATGPAGGALLDPAGGAIVKDNLKNVGAMPSGRERSSALAGLKHDVEQVAKGMAEMHGAMASGTAVDDAFKLSEIHWLDDKWKTALATGTVPAADAAKIETGLALLRKDFRAATLDATVVHGDAHIGNFSVKGKEVNVIDTETLFRSIGKDGKGTSPAATDVGRLFESLSVQGKAFGLTDDEIKSLQDAFIKQYKRSLPAAAAADFDVAMKFYQVNYDLIHLRVAATEAKASGDPIDAVAVDRLLVNLGVK